MLTSSCSFLPGHVPSQGMPVQSVFLAGALSHKQYSDQPLSPPHSHSRERTGVCAHRHKTRMSCPLGLDVCGMDF